ERACADPDAGARAWVDAHAASIGTVWAQPEQLPRTAHRIDLDPRRRDGLGRPVVRITHGLAADDRRRAAFLAGRMGEWLTAAGAARVWTAEPVAQPLGTHLYGGTRMGDDPATSVVDGHGVAHGAPGLVVLGSSTFPSTGGRGPTQTIEALAWRAAERLAERLTGG
ncbi:MAG: GMC oxidoreductase, partial [Solirubrobacteraceae bacterium]